MTIEKMITKHSVLLDLEVKNKKQLLEDLSKNMNLLAKKKFIKQNNNLRSNFYTKINKSNVKIFY